jgi:predicted phage replisome organizer
MRKEEIMENKKYYYMKLKENFFESESMMLLESVPNGILYSNILLKMYLKSLKSEGRLMFNEVIPYSPDMIASITRHPVGVVKEALKYFKQLDLIEILDNGTIYMNDIELFIGLSSTEGERKKLARMKLKEQGLIGGQMSDKCPSILSLNSNSLNSISIESNNINNKEKKKNNKFIKPTIEEIDEYCEERNNNVDATTFYDFYESKGWKVGTTPMKDWKACVRTWENKNKRTVKQECSLPEFD